MQTRLTLYIDTLCILAANKTNDGDTLKRFLAQFKEEKIDLDECGEKGLRVVEAAAMSGSVSTLEFLIKECEVDISSNEDTPNLVERALTNAEARDYLLNTTDKFWQNFNDDTTDFLADVMAGRFEAANASLEKDPDLICDHNHRFQNALYWSHAIKKHAAWYKAHAETQLSLNHKRSHWIKVARHHICIGHFKRHQFSNRPQVALLQYDASVQQYRQALELGSNTADGTTLKVELATALLHCARMHLLMKVNQPDAAIHSVKTSNVCVADALRLMRDLPKDTLQKNKYLFNSLLRLHAENNFILDDIYYAMGDSLIHMPVDAIEFYKLSMSHGEEAVRSIDEIERHSKHDEATITKYCDKLFMSYAAMKTCHANLANAEDNAENASHHREESDRYKELGDKLLNRETSKNLARFVQPPRVTPRFFVKPVNGHSYLSNGQHTNGHTNGHSNGHTNGHLNGNTLSHTGSPVHSSIRRLSPNGRINSVTLTLSPTKCGLKGDDISDALLHTPTYTALKI